LGQPRQGENIGNLRTLGFLGGLGERESGICGIFGQKPGKTAIMKKNRYIL
jgi:hypothetical protein